MLRIGGFIGLQHEVWIGGKNGTSVWDNVNKVDGVLFFIIVWIHFYLGRDSNRKAILLYFTLFLSLTENNVPDFFFTINNKAPSKSIFKLNIKVIDKSSRENNINSQVLYSAYRFWNDLNAIRRPQSDL